MAGAAVADRARQSSSRSPQRPLERDPRLPAGRRAQAGRVADLRGHVGGAQPLGIDPHLDAALEAARSSSSSRRTGRPVPLQTL